MSPAAIAASPRLTDLPSVAAPPVAAPVVEAAIGSDLTADQRAEILTLHNAARAAVGVEPLAWSADLARDAQVWADYLASSDRFEHDATIRGQQGENLAASFGYANPIEIGVTSWIDERNLNYVPGVPLAEAMSRATGVIGHYTQIVWRDTTALGCGLATGADGMSKLVCRYNPPGNNLRQVPY
ncbi:SCP-like extracellular [Leptolyngbya iicbica LK]|uniref:SCP-like extracellular n=3 Tax=Cyanophyceae TaxID=3028117 RepID=A0A4Q7E5T9_9CYAN|nr:SCP-like extracellular [Leptolyngbya sp. LK]